MGKLRFELAELNGPADEPGGVRTHHTVIVEEPDDDEGVSIIETWIRNGHPRKEKHHFISIAACVKGLLGSGHPVSRLLQYLFQEPGMDAGQRDTALKQLHDNTATFDWQNPSIITMVVNHANGTCEVVTFVLDPVAAAPASAEEQERQPVLLNSLVFLQVAKKLRELANDLERMGDAKDLAQQQMIIMAACTEMQLFVQRLLPWFPDEPEQMRQLSTDLARVLSDLEVLRYPPEPQE